eukprot:4446519-Prymnesium_polylepis.2
MLNAKLPYCASAGIMENQSAVSLSLDDDVVSFVDSALDDTALCPRRCVISVTVPALSLASTNLVPSASQC